MKDSYKTNVIFRKARYEDGSAEIIAIFPDSYEEYKKMGRYEIDCYTHIGQHSTAALDFYYSNTEKATPSEYKELFEELENIGYNIRIRQRMHY